MIVPPGPRRPALRGFSATAVCDGITEALLPGAQTKRRGDAGPVRVLLDGEPAPALSPLLSEFLLLGEMAQGFFVSLVAFMAAAVARHFWASSFLPQAS